MAEKRNNTDQFQLRMPPGLRDRIKTYAERHNRSLNAEIVRVLEREFPEQWPLDVRLSQLLNLSTALSRAVEAPLVDELGSSIEDLLSGIAAGEVPGVSKETRKNIVEFLLEWEASLGEKHNEEFEASLDEEELENRSITGRTAKFVNVDPKT